MSSSISYRSCLICTSPTKNAHLGIDACRACAAFFKRTISSGRQYSCRQGTNECIVRKKEKFICRKCRFVKCKKLGMEYNVKKNDKDEEKDNDEGLSIDTRLITPNQTILSRISTQFQISSDSRLLIERSLRKIYPNQHKKINHPTKELFLSTIDFHSLYMKLAMDEHYKFAINSFPQYSSLTLYEQKLLIKNFSGPYILLQGYYLSKEYFGDNCDYFPISEESCFYLNDIEFFSHTQNDVDKKEYLMKAIRHYTESSIEISKPMIQKANINPIEYHALLSIILWDVDSLPSTPSHICTMSEEIRKDIYIDLHRYYKEELKLDDYSVRFGHLMSLGHVMQEANSLMAEEMQVYNLLELFTEDNFIRQLLCE